MTETDVSTVQKRLKPILDSLHAMADEYRREPEVLLLLLREIEALHRDVQDGPFRESLPEDRQRLFRVLKTMEKSGGWPYIPRLQLRTFITMLDQDSSKMAA